MQIWPPDAAHNNWVAQMDREFQFKIKYGMLPGKLMRHGFITVIEDAQMARETQGERIGDRLYVKSIYAYLMSKGLTWTKDDPILDWCFELAMVRVLIKIKSIK